MKRSFAFEPLFGGLRRCTSRGENRESRFATDTMLKAAAFLVQRWWWQIKKCNRRTEMAVGKHHPF